MIDYFELWEEIFDRSFSWIVEPFLAAYWAWEYERVIRELEERNA